MTEEATLTAVAAFVQEHLAGEATGHDWWHADRVRHLALTIAAAENAETFTVALAALLHDIADEKFSGDPRASGRITRRLLTDLAVPATVIDHVVTIIATLSFGGARVAEAPMSLEGACVRDADRLDALGAIGIARVFAYGGQTGRPIHDPAIPPLFATNKPQYRAHRGTSVNHFYEKLLLIKDRMSTTTGRQLAEERHAYMLAFLARFHDEWAGRD